MGQGCYRSWRRPWWAWRKLCRGLRAVPHFGRWSRPTRQTLRSRWRKAGCQLCSSWKFSLPPFVWSGQTVRRKGTGLNQVEIKSVHTPVKISCFFGDRKKKWGQDKVFPIVNVTYCIIYIIQHFFLLSNTSKNILYKDWLVFRTIDQTLTYIWNYWPYLD